jgi:predicted RecB family nuclease
MRISGETVSLAATDLANHLSCVHLTQLEKAAVKGELRRPTWTDPAAEVLQQKGFEHERNYIEHLTANGLEIVGAVDGAGSVSERVLELMHRGVDGIAQAVLGDGRWVGRADLLLRVERPSDLGDWSYEVVDTKLAAETRAGTILQLCLYSDLVGRLQGCCPELMHVVAPGRDFQPESFRTTHYLAYYRQVRKRLMDAVAAPDKATTYPEPVPHCELCSWWRHCDQRRHDDDHLSLVAGIARSQRDELNDWGIQTLESLGSARLDVDRRPKRGAREGLDRAQDQARVQLEGRRRREPYFEIILPIEEGSGLARLPEPNTGDVFFDIEGDPFVGTGGLEYLLGWTMVTESEKGYRAIWSYDGDEERVAFERFVDQVMRRWQDYPTMHIYHFAPYEPAALKRLMGRHATREEEVDQMLRGGLFVDLYAVVREGLRASVESYSIKQLEQFYGFSRVEGLAEVGLPKRKLEAMLELGHGAAIPAVWKDAVQRYNEDDCWSTMELRDWLEQIRCRAQLDGNAVPRPAVEEPQAAEELQERERKVQMVRELLLRDVPAQLEERTVEQQGRWLLAYMLDWHRREEKVTWWEYFRLREMADDDLLHEKAAISGLQFLHEVPGPGRTPTHRYRFPQQLTEIREDKKLKDGAGDDFGSVVAVDPVNWTIDIKKTQRAADQHPASVFVFEFIGGEAMAQALMRLGEWVAERGIDEPGFCRAGRDLLLRFPPRRNATNASRLQGQDELSVDAARRLILELGEGLLPIQGPPGAGKTYTGGQMICELVKANKRVGVTAVSHKVIRNLLDSAIEATSSPIGGRGSCELRCVHKVSARSDEAIDGIFETTSNDEALSQLKAGKVQVVGGTAWLWSRPEFLEAVDVLFVDEAGQMSLANTLAVAQGARNLVLLGDPQQLEQPQQGSHPEGTDVSALQHVLGGSPTMPDHRGLFLERTWRLHPRICAFTSSQFYEDKLTSRDGLDRQLIWGSRRFNGAGLFVLPVDHQGNQSVSAEEVDCIEEVMRELLWGGVTWMSGEGRETPLTHDDILIVAPYNVQVADLQARLPEARVGTVDKFQGQEAAVVIYSMTTSSADEAPRGMEFLYSLNRLNVATSRARCACILVASPRLFEPDCKSPRQMRLANAFCEFLERKN